MRVCILFASLARIRILVSRLWRVSYKYISDRRACRLCFVTEQINNIAEIALVAMVSTAYLYL